MRCRSALPAVCVLLLLAVANANAQLPLRLVVAGAGSSRTNAAASFPLPQTLPAGQCWRLIETTGGQAKPVATQQQPGEARLWWLVEGALAPGQARTYRLEAGPAAPQTPLVQITDTDQTVEATTADKKLLRYNKVHVEPGPEVEPRYGRSAHLHPVWSPSGVVVTDEFPPDHLHQSGVFFSYTRTRFEGRNVDFWNLAEGKGRVRFKDLKSASGGAVFGEFQAEQEFVDLTAAGEKLTADSGKPELGKVTGGKVALIESWRVRVWPAGLKAGYWLMDVESTQRCATTSPLVLPEYHYGGMAIRGARSWTPGQVTFLTSEGDERIKGNHTRPKWCDIRGSVDERAAGIAALTHPGNFRFPEPLRIHPTMPYMVYTPQFLGEFTIEPGQEHRSRYRWVVHDGQLSPEDLNQLWLDYAEPLVAVVSSGP